MHHHSRKWVLQFLSNGTDVPDEYSGGLGLSQRNIMQSINVSQKTVVKVQRRAREMNLSWSLDESLTDIELGKLMFPMNTSGSKSNEHVAHFLVDIHTVIGRLLANK